MAVSDFRELDVYRLAYKNAMRIYQLSKAFPKEETYSLTDQIRRCSRSICANVAEAWRKRRYEAAFVSKLSDADAEAGETLVWVEFACDCGFLDVEVREELIQAYDRICRMLTAMMNSSARWCP